MLGIKSGSSKKDVSAQMSLFWHSRFSQQVCWTRSVRQYIFQKIGLASFSRILEVGCGTGALLESLAQDGPAITTGLDINLHYLHFASGRLPLVGFTQGDALSLPLENQIFDVTLCHFLLLWLTDPFKAICEMVRVTRQGGYVVALAEPDYPARIDFPPALEPLGHFQQLSLKQQGADVSMGRQLRRLFTQSGLVNVEAGVLGGQWSAGFSSVDHELEWQVMEQDLSGIVPSQELSRLREIDRSAWMNGERVLFVPTFYALGQVP